MGRSFATAAFVAIASLVGLAACGGAVAPSDPSPGDPDPAPGTYPTSGPDAPPAPTGGEVVPPPPRCDPARCALPHVEAHVCRRDVCAPGTCAVGFLDCDGDPANGCETRAEARYADEDGDGLGAREPTTTCPKAGVTYVASGDDCDDTSALARPGQTAYFTQPRANGTFDYDCNGTDEPRVTKLYTATCVCSDLGCSLGEGWIGTVPACGETGTWARAPGGSSCTPIPEQRGQACR